MKRSQIFIVLLQVIADIFLAAAAFYAAYRINLRYDPTVGSFGQYVPMMVIYRGHTDRLDLSSTSCTPGGAAGRASRR